MLKKHKIHVSLLILAVALTSFTYSSKEPGDTIDNFTINNYDGKTYSPAELKDYKALVIMFWSTTCPNVQPYTDRINSLAKEYQDKGFVFWGINSNSTEPTDEVKQHAAEKKYPFPMLKDKNNVVADMFDATKTPEVFVLNPSLVILYHGRIDNDRDESKVTSEDLKKALDEIYEGKEVSVKTTKHFGCTIKRIGQ
jgi:peroxiredoxin